MNAGTSKKHIVFLRLMPNANIWGGLEKLTLEWFERIDTSQCRIFFLVNPGWKSTFEQHFRERGIESDIIEFPFQCKGRVLKKFFQLL